MKKSNSNGTTAVTATNAKTGNLHTINVPAAPPQVEEAPFTLPASNGYVSAEIEEVETIELPANEAAPVSKQQAAINAALAGKELALAALAAFNSQPVVVKATRQKKAAVVLVPVLGVAAGTLVQGYTGKTVYLVAYHPHSGQQFLLSGENFAAKWNVSNDARCKKMLVQVVASVAAEETAVENEVAA